MYNHWAFAWVQILAHNKRGFGLFWAGISLFVLVGISRLQSSLETESWWLLGLSLLVMSGLMAWLLDSLKVALVQLFLGGYILAMTLGGLGWSGRVLGEVGLLGLITLLTLMNSNLIHILSTLLREMARGQFQYDALAEALKLNSGPIFLANLTTALGFLMAAWFEPQWRDMAWLVCVGALVSYLATLSVLPLILLRWLLEFRVGHSADRHGYLFGLEWLKRFPKLAWTFWGGFLLLITVLFWRNSAQVDWLFELGVMLLLMGALLAWFWRSIGLALLNVVANTLALLASVLLVAQLWPQFEIILLLVLVPLGLIVDDGIHFFSRYRRAQQEVFRSGDEAVRYAMASVARPIWMTTWITFAGLSVLLLSSEPRVQQAAAITLLGLLVASFVVLFMVPWWLLIQARFRSGSGSDPAEKRRVTRS